MIWIAIGLAAIVSFVFGLIWLIQAATRGEL